MLKSDYVSLQRIRVKTHKNPPLLTFRAICYMKLRDPLPGRHVLVHCGVNFDRTYWDFV